jgi:hypothetical protein
MPVIGYLSDAAGALAGETERRGEVRDSTASRFGRFNHKRRYFLHERDYLLGPVGGDPLGQPR